MRQRSHSCADGLRPLWITLWMIAMAAVGMAQDVPAAANSGLLPGGSGERRALVIGNDHYAGAALRNAINDARAMHEALTADGFRAALATDVDMRRLEAALGSFVQELQPGDVALLYYSGHGIQVDGENYFVPLDFSASSEQEAKYAAYPVSRALQRIHDRGVRLTLLILDACRDNPFRLARSLQRGWAPMTSGRGAYIAFATAPGSTASDGSDGNGLFTKHLLRVLQEPGLGLDEVFGRVRAAVYTESNSRQLPWSASSVIGDFVFTPAGSGRRPARTAAKAAARASQGAPHGRGVAGSQPAPAMPAGSEDQAAQYLQAGEYLQAIDAYTRLVGASPDDPALYRARGRARLLAHRFDEAVEDFSRAVGLDPSDAEALYDRSLAYVASAHYDLALRDATAALERQPDMIAAYLSRAGAYLGLEQYKLAAEDCDRVLRSSPNLGLAYALRGAVYVATGQSEAAAADFRKAAALGSGAQ